ncbi:NAD-dependent epimerase/dehydratase family protein [Aurantimonas endophytica]|uniref:UDP-glucose 4-epimerase n=1 Tax=Aurantimonas endophytica TaxID=1522175 RepID=A0A7W6MMQ5_9HYPH|nr:NAD-dependent epimerase/dehydratase family protein [Aurantimonas endophytica]MBB4001100.1 UDP-glucose 4-epimerase [Aurantimonas endophytica]MCO6403245.1 NAD-dependent epimerase/dehydratase family protein [Aurantimonas endophytica]
MRILLTGSSGFVGRHLHPWLRARGHDVVALARGAGAPGPDTIQGPADIADIELWRSWPSDIEAIVHLAALNPGRGDAAANDLPAIRRANVEGTAALARRAGREGVGRVVFVGTAHVHAPRDGLIRESDPLAPANAYAISKAEAEVVFWHALAGTGTQGCVLRPAPVYGAGARGSFGTLLGLARRKLPLPLDGFGGPRSLVAVDQLCTAIALSLELSAAEGETFLVADDGPLAPADIVRALRGGWGRPAMVLPAPAAMMAIAAGWTGKAARWRELSTPFVIDTGHLQDKLGWEPGANTAERLKHMAATGVL